MEEEMKNEKLEKTLDEISRSFSDKPHIRELLNILNREGKTSIRGVDEITAGEFYIENGQKFFRFYDNYKNVFSNDEIEIVKNTLKENGYELRL